TGLNVELKLSGPKGGDAQIAALTAEGKVDGIIFFRDPLGKHVHEPDIHMLMRISDLYNVPLATNPATGRLMIEGLCTERSIDAMTKSIITKIGKDPYRTEIHVQPHVILADEPKDMGGRDLGPAPAELLLSSIGSCKVITMRMYADRKQWDLTGAEISLSI